MKHSGEVVRARTGFAVDSPEDKPVQVLFVDEEGQDRSMLMRGGMICDHRMHGRLRAVLTICKAMEQRGLRLRDDGLFEAPDGSAGPVMWEGVPGDHLAVGRHIPFVRLLKLHRETTPLMALIGGKSVANPLAEARWRQ